MSAGTDNPYQPPERPTPEPRAVLRRSFRVTYLPLLLAVVAALYTTVAVMAQLTTDGGVLYFVFAKPWVLAGEMLGGLAYSAVVAAGIRYVYTIEIYDKGVRGWTFWGRRKLLPWDSISHANRTWFAWIPYLRIYSEVTAAPLWLPLNLDEREDFCVVLTRSIQRAGHHVDELQETLDAK